MVERYRLCYINYDVASIETFDFLVKRLHLNENDGLCL